MAVRVLLVDDDEDEYVITNDLLRSVEGEQFDLTWVATYDRGLQSILSSQFDVCLLDYRLGARNGLELIAEAARDPGDIQYVLMTGQGDREVDLTAMRSGAADYLVKRELTSASLERAIRFAVERGRTLRMLRDAINEAERLNHTKSSFLAAMSHEIRTPMNAILGTADLLWETVLDSVQREYVARFRRAGANLLTLINDILDLSKIESGHFELEAVDFDLLEVVDRAMEIASPRAGLKNITVETQVTPSTPTSLVGDPVRLQQILNNLISNAIKFTNSGKVILQVGPHEDLIPGHIQFAVSDTGIGIPADKLSTIFDDFSQAESSTTRRFGGTGLGLGICRRLIEKMDGALTVESVLERGSTFQFDAAFTISLRAAEALPKDPIDLTGKLVLVVDDNATSRMIISQMCAAWGMKTRAASSSAAALTLIAEAQQSNEQFSIFLLDHVLLNTEGFEILQEMKRLDGNVPIIIARSDYSKELTDATAWEAEAYLLKPVRKNELLSSILSALSTAPSAGSPRQSVVHRAGEHVPALSVLLVEDSDDNRFLVEAYLAGENYQLTFAGNGQEAVDAFRNGKFDVILMDVQMPVMDGLTATANIRALERVCSQKPTPIVALSADARVEDSQRSRQAGCDAHLTKPISKDRLIAAVESLRGYAHSSENSNRIN